MPSNTTATLDLIDIEEALTRAAYLSGTVRITSEAHDRLVRWDADANRRKHLDTTYYRTSENTRTRELLLRVTTQLRSHPDQDHWQFPAAVIPWQGTSDRAANVTVHVILDRAITGDILIITTTDPTIRDDVP